MFKSANYIRIERRNYIR